MYQEYFERAKAASLTLTNLAKDKVNMILRELSLELVLHTELIIEANRKDLDRMSSDDPRYDRLKLDAERIKGMAQDLLNVAALNSPIGEEISSNTLDNGLQLTKVRVPLGVIGVIYESRPNVTVDVFSLCFKTGNVAILKGGSDAEWSNMALVKVIRLVLRSNSIDDNALVLLPSEREATAALLNARAWVDVIIPRGSQQLINYVREHSNVPIIETGAGIVHTYFDLSGDVKKAGDIIFNAKTRRVSVCNALDCLIIHEQSLHSLFAIVERLAEKQVQLYADEQAYAVLMDQYPAALLFPAADEDYGTEFLDYKMAIKTVPNIEAALEHIAKYSSKHSEAIITEDLEQQLLFLNRVDAAAVYANASTAFTDGGQFGLGAEIGISTQKLHARGPMGLAELTSYKWVIIGNGQVR